MLNERIDILLVGYENQENLGLRYITSYLALHGKKARIQAFNPGSPENVLKAIRETQPYIVGFSLIFQYTLPEFGDLARWLRANGVSAHFTAGGHYPSLRPEQSLQFIPELDSIVRFEGEETTFELLQALQSGADWHRVAGIAFRDDSRCITTPTRPLITPLDSLPWSYRSPEPNPATKYQTAPILASRGCLYNCSFCSIQAFYRGTSGAPRRTRAPQDVADEMRHLFDTHNTRVFLFQDDDFVLKGRIAREWTERFLQSLDNHGLKGKILWKISARVDDIYEPQVLERCREYGLIAVYMGIESGNGTGLGTLNKHVTVEQNLAAIHLLQSMDIAFDLGFMLFDPDSNFQTVRENIAFLDKIANLNGPPLAFVKMLPLAGTAIEKRLKEQNRLIGTELRPDYRLEDPRLEYYSLFVTLSFSQRNSAPDGFVERFRQAYFAKLLEERFEGQSPASAYSKKLSKLIRAGNESALSLLRNTLDMVESCQDAREVALLWPKLRALADEKNIEWDQLIQQLDALTPSPRQQKSSLRPKARKRVGEALSA